MDYVIKKNRLSLDVDPIASEFQVFMTCCQCKSMSKASDILGLQQSAVSKIIGKLEKNINAILFIRVKNGLELSEAGEFLFKALGQLKVEWEHHWEDRLNTFYGHIGDFKIGMHSVIALNVLSYFFEPMLKQFEGLKPELEFAPSIEIANRVWEGKIDMGLVINPIRHANLVSMPIWKENISLWDGPHAKVDKEVLFYNPDMYKVETIIKKLKIKSKIAIADYEVMASLIKSNQGVGLLPNTVAQRYELRRIGGPLIQLNLAAIYHKERMQSLKKVEVVRFIVESLKSKERKDSEN